MSEDEARIQQQDDDDVDAHARSVKANEEPAQEGDDGDDVEGHAIKKA